MSRPKLLDLFCGQGGASAGYSRAGFDVTGVDSEPQPRYPFRVIRADALEYLAAFGSLFDVIAASPPCQHYSQSTSMNKRLHGKTYPDLLPATRQALIDAGVPYVIENVMGAPMRNCLMLCGSMFFLQVQRHRLFESSHLLFAPGPCRHSTFRGGYPNCFQPRGGQRNSSSCVQVYGNTPGKALWPEAMGIDWMTSKGITQAIPPAYTFHIGKQLMRMLFSEDEE